MGVEARGYWKVGQGVLWKAESSLGVTWWCRLPIPVGNTGSTGWAKLPRARVVCGADLGGRVPGKGPPRGLLGSSESCWVSRP